METKTKTDIKTNTFAADDVKCLELRIAAAGVEVKEAAAGEIRIEAENVEEGQYDCGVTEGTLAVHYQFKNALINLPNKQIVHITLYIPSGMFLKTLCWTPAPEK